MANSICYGDTPSPPQHNRTSQTKQRPPQPARQQAITRLRQYNFIIEHEVAVHIQVHKANIALSGYHPKHGKTSILHSSHHSPHQVFNCRSLLAKLDYSTQRRPVTGEHRAANYATAHSYQAAWNRSITDWMPDSWAQRCGNRFPACSSSARCDGTKCF